jgi:uncharacterized protein (TIGR02598 family)
MRALFVKAFSLIEIVLALGICAFCLVALIGLFSVGMKSSRESVENQEVANLASLLITQRRSAPTNSTTPFSLLPPLTSTANNSNAPTFINTAGEIAPESSADYRMIYDIQTTPQRVSRVSLSLSAPASLDPTNARTRYNVITYARLP